MKNIKVGVYNSKNFVIECPAFASGIVKNMPASKFYKSKLHWRAPIIRHNVKYVKEIFMKHADCEISEDAIKVVHDFDNRLVPSNRKLPLFGFKTEPMAHQYTAMELAYPHDNFAFFMDMGTGKSKVVIDLACMHYMEKKIAALIVITKLSIRRNWLSELEKHCSLPYEALLMNTRFKNPVYAMYETDINTHLHVLLVGVESLSSGKAFEQVKEYMVNMSFTASHKIMLAIDESSTIKNHKAKRTARCGELGSLALFRYILTGTPISLGLIDLYSQFQFLDENIIGIGSYYAFRNRYAIMGGFKEKQIIGYHNTEELMEDIAPFVYQVTSEEVLPELPPKVYQERTCTMTKEQKELYTEILKERVSDEESEIQNALEKVLRLHQIVGGFRAIRKDNPDPLSKKKFLYDMEQIKGQQPKIELLFEIISETPHQIIIWAAYIPEIKMIADILKKRFGKEQVVEIHGGIAEEERDKNIREIFQGGHARFCVGNTQTGGMGLEMQAAAVAVYYSNSSIYENRMQSEKRPHRKGFKHSHMTYIDLVMEQSVDIHFLQAMVNKQDMVDYVRTKLAKGEEVL